MGKDHKASVKNYRHLDNGRSGRNGLTQGGTHQLAVEYQMVRPEDTNNQDQEGSTSLSLCAPVGCHMGSPQPYSFQMEALQMGLLLFFQTEEFSGWGLPSGQHPIL